MASSSSLVRHHVRMLSDAGPPIVFAHGYGCDQSVWRDVAPAFADTHQPVVFDFVGAGRSDLSAYDKRKYATLDGHARDLIELCESAGLERPLLVAHSVSTMVGVLAAQRRPGYFRGLVLVAPNPCYIDDDDYQGGFSREDIEELLETLDSNYFSWARMMAPVVMGNADRPELSERLANSFCSTDPAIARDFARVTFLADHRDDLPSADLPCLVLQCSNDALAPPAVGTYVQRRLPRADLVVMRATGHCPHLSAPAETVAAIRRFAEALPG